jgi:hypothetical protein
VVGLQSKPLAAALNGEFEASSPVLHESSSMTNNGHQQEAKTGIIRLDNHDPEIVGHMINFMYSGNYTPSLPHVNAKPEEQPRESAAPATTTPEEPVTCEEPSLETLPDTSEELLTHTAVYVLAEEKDIPSLKMLAKKKYKEALPNGWNSEAFCKSLKMIWEETPEDDTLLWDVASKYAGKKAKQLMDRGEFATLCKENAEIGFAVFRAFVSSNPGHLEPVYLRPAGCPDIGASHAPNVGKGRRTKYYCYICSKGFN